MGEGRAQRAARRASEPPAPVPLLPSPFPLRVTSVRSRPASWHRASLFVGLGSVLATGAVAPGCRSDDAPPTPEADLAVKGVWTDVAEVEPGRYVITNETVADAPTKVTVARLDGTTETIDDPDRFAALLAPPDTFAALAKRAPAPLPTKARSDTATTGAGGSWDVPSAGDPAPASGEAPREGYRAGGGFPLGTLLFYSLAMNAWRPPAYGAAAYAPPGAYRDGATAARSRTSGAAFAGFQQRGLAPRGLAEARVQRSAWQTRSRAATPSNGRSGFRGGRGVFGG